MKKTEKEGRSTIIGSKVGRIIFYASGIILGVLIGTFLVFQVLFLYRVLPHGGI